MKYDAKEFKRYPEIMSKEQMRIACHISKRTALYLLQFNLIPHTCTGKKTRCYAIKKSDVIAFMNDREVNPEKYIAPKNWYKYGGEIVRPYKIRIQPPCAKDEKKLRRYYESKLAALPDVMDVAAAVDFTGYNRRTVCQWIRVGKLKALALLRRLQQHKPKIPPAYRYALGGAEMERLMRTFSLVFSKRGTGASFPWRLLKKRRFCDTIITISRAFAEATEKPGGNKNEQ